MKSWFLFMGLIGGLAGISLAQDKPFPNIIPSKFFIQAGGGLDYRDSVELKDGVVTFQRKVAGKVLPEKTFHLSPDKAAWTRFLQEINETKLYRWSKIYPNPGVYDGEQWSVDMEIDGRKIHSEGDNNYPVDGNESKPTNSPQGSPAFDRLCQAVSHLIGQEFR